MPTGTIFLLLITHFLIHTTAIARTDSSRYHIGHFTVEHGLPQNSINGIGVDEFGFVWLATEGGITRFDGRNFKEYDHESLGLKSARMTLIRYVEGTQKLYGMNALYEKFLLSKGRAWHYDHTGEDWMIITPQKVIDEPFQNATGLPAYYKNTGSSLYQIDGPEHGNYIISHDSVFYYNQDHIVQSRIAYPNDEFYRFFPLQENLFHLDKTGRIKKISLSGQVIEYELTGDLITDGKNPGEVRIYWNIGTTDIYLYVEQSFYLVKVAKDKNELITKLLLAGFDFDKNNIFSTHYDPRHKRLFLGSRNKGLFVITRKKFKAMNGGDHLAEQVFYGQAPFRKDYVITTQGYIFSDTGLVDTKYNIRKATSDRRSIIRDHKGYIWTTSSWKWLYKFSPDLNEMLMRKNMPLAISCIHEGKNNQIWLGTFAGEVLEYDPETDTFKRYAFPSDEVVCLLQTSPDTLMAGTLHSGLLQLHIPSGKIDTIPGLAQKSIRSIYYDNEKYLWVTTYNEGVFLYYKGKVTQFPFDRKNHLRAAHCILEDNSGFFWISTNNGLFQVKKQQLLDYLADRTLIPQYFHYTKDAGFNTNEFNGGCQPCGVKTGNGYFSFPSMNGVVWFRPEDIIPEVPDREIIVDAFSINGIGQSLRDTFNVEHGFKQIKIEIATAYFGHPDNLHLEYRISQGENDNSQWFAVENESIFLNDLRSGIHQVAIRQANFNELEGYNRANVFIVVPTFFYETWAFFGICIFGVLILLWAFMKWRSGRIQAQNLLLQQKVDSQTYALQEYVSELEKSESNLIRQTNLLENLSAAISHDIKSPLSFVIHALDDVSEVLSKEGHPLANRSRTTYSHVLQVYEYVNTLTSHTSSFLTHSKQESELVILYDLVQERIDFFVPFADQKGNTLINDIDPKCELHTIRELIKVVIHNLIDNANKYSAEGTIIISAVKNPENVTIKIADTGVGMDLIMVQAINSGNPIHKNGLGLQIVQYLSLILQCQFSIKSQPGQGTTATLLFGDDQPVK